MRGALILLLVGCGGGTPAVDAPPEPVVDAAPPDVACAIGGADAADPGCAAVGDRLDEALGVARLDRCSLGYPEGLLGTLYPASLAADADRLPWYDAVWARPIRAIAWARGLAGETSSPSMALHAATAKLGVPVRGCEVASDGRDLAEIVADLAGEIVDDSLDGERRARVLPLVRAVAAAALAREAALAELDETERLIAFYAVQGFTSPAGSGSYTPEWLGVLRGERFGYATLYEAAVDLALALEAFEDAGEGTFHATTPIGDIIVAGAENDVHDGSVHALLIVDLGGNDRYTGPYGATPDVDHGVGVVLDLAGDDVYDYVEVPDPNDTPPRMPSDEAGRAAPGAYYGAWSRSTVPRQGSGILGIGMLFDRGDGVDQYRSLRLSQGHGALGVGVLFDQGGADVYLSEAASQGAGEYGIGILIDGAGPDVYRAYTMSQGFGYVRGAGILADLGDSDDVYWIEPDDIIYYSPQLPGTGNTSLSQGAGFGRRGDSDGVYQSGGFGLLRDQGGNDQYTASVFAQGTGYWFGTGILSDGGGDDTYDGAWYVQGSAAHFALCLFLDDEGADRYNQTAVPAATSIGVGHDWSVGIHLDGGGDDLYRAPGLSLGAGNANGIGMFLNLGGSDEYHAAGEPTVGVANLSGEIPAGSAREMFTTIGLFVDVGGIDLYDVPGSDVVRGDDTTWTNDRREPPLETEHSAGLDAADGDVTLP